MSEREKFESIRTSIKASADAYKELIDLPKDEFIDRRAEVGRLIQKMIDQLQEMYDLLYNCEPADDRDLALKSADEMLSVFTALQDQLDELK